MTTIAQTILSQLGGNRFCAMTGAKNLLNGGDYLQFDVPGARQRGNKCRIVLTADDLYNMEFYKFSARTLECVKVHEQTGIYADQLQRAFTAATGLYTKL